MRPSLAEQAQRMFCSDYRHTDRRLSTHNLLRGLAQQLPHRLAASSVARYKPLRLASCAACAHAENNYCTFRPKPHADTDQKCAPFRSIFGEIAPSATNCERNQRNVSFVTISCGFRRREQPGSYSCCEALVVSRPYSIYFLGAVRDVFIPSSN
jgi:hypothetical protein